MRKAWVFVMVLGHSRHMFARIVFDQTVGTWLRLHVEAFEGCTRTATLEPVRSGASSHLTFRTGCSRSGR